MEILSTLEFKKLLNDNPTKKFVFTEWIPKIFTTDLHISSGDPEMPYFGATTFGGDPDDDLIYDYDWSINEYSDDELFLVLSDDDVKEIAGLFNEVVRGNSNVHSNSRRGIMD